MAANQGNNGHQPLAYLPNEICVVVSATDDRLRLPDLYDVVLKEVSTEIGRVQAADLDRLVQTGLGNLNTPEHLRPALAEDLLPRAFRDAFTNDRPRFALQPLPPARLEGLKAKADTLRQAAVSFRRWDPGQIPAAAAQSVRAGAAAAPWTEVHPATALHYYQLGPDQDQPPVAQDDLDVIQGLVHLLTLGLRPGLDARLREHGVQLDAVTPNWLTFAAQITSGSPGSWPKPTKPGKGQPDRGRWTFMHQGSKLPPCPQLPQAPVVVAVLDTSPTNAAVDKAIESCGQNTLLAEMAKVVDEGQSIPDAYLARYKPGWPDGVLPQAPAIPDHGLFVAGIVRDIAPRAQLRLIRALNDYGTGDMLAITHLLNTLVDEVLFTGDEPTDRRLVVNLSLGADIPPGKKFMEDCFPKTYGILRARPAFARESDLQTALQQEFPQFWDYLNCLHAGLERAIVAGGNRLLVVAAAGNDRHRARPGGYPPEPRWPARYDGVLGVAAVQRDHHPAGFSNRGDVKEFYNGVATFGGDADNQGEINDRVPEDQIDAVRGLYIGPLPLETEPGARATGVEGEEGGDHGCWALWSGTSFATPVISGIAANLWATDGNQTPSDLIGEAVRLATDDRTRGPQNLDCSTIAASQQFVPR